MWTSAPSRPDLSAVTLLYKAPAIGSIGRLFRARCAAPFLVFSVLSCLQMPAQDTGITLRPTEATLTIASPAESPVKISETRTVITVTAAVRSGGRPVSPGVVLFCDADAAFCEDGAIVGKAQLRANGTAVLRLSPATLARHHNLKAIFAGTTSYGVSTSSVVRSEEHTSELQS